MTLNECVYWAGTGVVVYDAVIASAHVFMYGKRSNWLQFEEGKALMFTMGTYAVVLAYVALVNLQIALPHLNPSTLEGYPQRGIVRLVIYGFVGIGVTWWFLLLLRNQRRSRRHANER